MLTSQSPSSKLRLAVVGVGHLGRIHARLAAAMDEVELVAVVDPFEANRVSSAEETGARALADYRDLFGEVDAAVVATPTFTHRQVAGELLRGGIHTLVEKPLAPSVTESEELVQLAKQNQLTLQVGHVERFNPGYQAVQERIGDPKFIQATRQSGYTFRSTDVGVVLDLMIHDIDATLALVRSPVTSVEALGIAVLGEHEDMVSARLNFASGAVASLSASRVSYQPQRTMQVFSSRGFGFIDFATRTATVVDPTEGVLRREFKEDDYTPGEKKHLHENLFAELLVKDQLEVEECNAIAEEIRDFAHSIQTGSTPRVTGADGRDAVAVAAMVLDQVAQHQWDGTEGGRIGPLAMPALPLPIAGSVEAANTDVEDTVIFRKAG